MKNELVAAGPRFLKAIALAMAIALCAIPLAQSAMSINGGEVVRATPAANTAADVTLAATPGVNYTIKSIIASYSGVPTGGRLGVLSNGVIVHDVDIVAAGPVQLLPFDMTEETTNVPIVIRLFPGGAGVTGKLTVSFIRNNILP